MIQTTDEENRIINDLSEKAKADAKKKHCAADEIPEEHKELYVGFFDIYTAFLNKSLTINDGKFKKNEIIQNFLSSRHNNDKAFRVQALKSEISHGIMCGISDKKLLIKAIECIGILTDDNEFCKNSKGDIRIEGLILNTPEVLEYEMKNACTRLGRLMEYISGKDADDNIDVLRTRRIIKEHEQYITKLQNKLNNYSDRRI